MGNESKILDLIGKVQSTSHEGLSALWNAVNHAAKTADKGAHYGEIALWLSVINFLLLAAILLLKLTNT